MQTAATIEAYLSNPGLSLPRRLTWHRIAKRTCNAHRQDGGATVHPHFGDLKGRPLFAVSLYPERTVRINGQEAPPEVVVAFLRQNADLFRDPRIVLGTWYNTEEDVTYLDVTAVCSDYHEAVALGRKYNQIGIYDLANEVEIDLGGTGEETLDPPPETERLPPWRQVHEE